MARFEEGVKASLAEAEQQQLAARPVSGADSMPTPALARGTAAVSCVDRRCALPPTYQVWEKGDDEILTAYGESLTFQALQADVPLPVLLQGGGMRAAVVELLDLETKSYRWCVPRLEGCPSGSPLATP